MLRHAAVGLTVAILACSLPGPGRTRAAEPAATDVLAEFPIRKDAAFLTVPVEFRGQTLRFLLDTGCSYVVFDKAFAGQLGPPLRSTQWATSSDEISVPLYAAPEAMLGPLSLRTDESVACLDLGFIEAKGLGRVDGVVGMSFLKQYALTLNFTTRKIQLRHEVAIAEGQATALHLHRLGHPLIKVTLPGEASQDYELDTGFVGDGTLKTDPTTFERLRRQPQAYAQPDQQTIGLGGVHTERSCDLEWATVAGFKLIEVPITESKNGSQVVGMGAIRRLNWTLDFPKQRMAVSRNWIWELQ